MTTREQAIGKNEALFREVNERIREVTTYRQDAEFLCECGDATCAEPVSLRLEEYESVRSKPTDFLIVPGHAVPDLESVVLENERYAVVRKDASVPREIAVESDPRARP